MTDSKLTISTQISDNAGLYTFTLAGQIDVTAGQALDAIDEIAPDTDVVLDFAAVDRINSMGLAQLMKLLEKWKNNSIRIEAINLNRMTSMLFKMTGLNRYFDQAQALTENSRQGSSKQATSDNAVTAGGQATQTKLRQVRRIRKIKNPANKPAEDDKLSFTVSLQSNQQLTGWYFFNTLLQRRLEKAITIDVKQPGQAVNLHEQALVYAKPFDACVLIKEHQFIPVARPMNDTDEVSIVVRKADEDKAITDFAGASVVTAMRANFVYLLGRFLCDECDLDSAKLTYTFTGNEIKALQTLLKGQADVLFMLKKNYHELSRLSRQDTHLLDESEISMAYHMLLLSPYHSAMQQTLSENLLKLHEDEKGAQVLNDLGLKGWCKPEDDELGMLMMLYDRYVEGLVEV